MLINNDHLALIRANQPKLREQNSLMQAAVAIILRDGEHGSEFLMMQRAFHENDPWSGQMSFPGGKIEADDVDAKAAAIRETHEEVGVDLREHEFVGQLDDLYGLKVDGVYSVHVAAFVFKTQRELQLQGNHEVADMLWIPFAFLDDEINSYDYYHPLDESQRMPAILLNEGKQQVLWGLSLRMLSMLHEMLDLPMSAIEATAPSKLKEIEQRNYSKEDLQANLRKRVMGEDV